MKTKKIMGIITGVMLVLTMLTIVSAFSSDEDEEGNPLYIADGKVIVPSININQLLVLKPSLEPRNPEAGMVYFDSESNRLKLYDGTGWYAIALEKVSSVSRMQVKEIVESKGDVKECSESTECGEWGDCINNYESMTCITIDSNCNKYEDTETRDCISENKLQSPAKGSHEFEEEEEEVGGEVVEGATSEVVEGIEEQEDEVEVVEEGEAGEEEQDDEVEVEEEGEAEEEEEIPEELFDITFDLEESSLSQSDKLVLWSTLQNFGKRYIPARLVYSVIDESGEEVYREFEEIRVYTDHSIIKRFDNLILEEGDYTLSMSVEYAGIVEEFSDSFTVEKGFFVSIKRWFGGWF